MHRDTRWENVWAYSGQIRNFNPDHWSSLLEHEIYEFYVEVKVGDRIYSHRYVEEISEIKHSRANNLGVEKEILDYLVQQVDKRMRRRRSWTTWYSKSTSV